MAKLQILRDACATLKNPFCDNKLALMGQRPRSLGRSGSGLKVRSKLCLLQWCGLSALSAFLAEVLGRCPRLVWCRAFGAERMESRRLSLSLFQMFTRMSLAFLLVFWLALPVAGLGAHKDDQPDKQAIQISGESHLQADVALSVSFPTAMVTAAEIDLEAKECPLRFEPPLAGKFVWKSETEGEFKPTAVPPGHEFNILLRAKLADASGKPVSADGPIGTRASEPFQVEALYYGEDPNNALERRPSIALRFHPKVKPADLAEAAWFQDRDSREHYPVEVVLQDEAAGPVDSATVTPRSDLPAGRTFDLIVDGLKEAVTGTKLPTVYVKALGETRSLKV